MRINPYTKDIWIATEDGLALAEWVGWSSIDYSVRVGYRGVPPENDHRYDSKYYKKKAANAGVQVPIFFNDLNLLYDAEKEIEKKGLQKEYIKEIHNVLIRVGERNIDTWRLLHLSKYERAFALLKVIGREEEKI